MCLNPCLPPKPTFRAAADPWASFYAESVPAAEHPRWVTRELSSDTWSDFVALFSRGNGWDYCACMYFQRGGELPTSRFRTRAERRVQNQHDKCELVDQGRAHGILVYIDGESIGWCQYGRVDELPLAERGRGRLPAAPAIQPDWRITCFVTDKRYRHIGVARAALRTALGTIRRDGGGIVEAYPIAHWTRGKDSAEPFAELVIDGAGPVVPARGTFGHVSTQGTVSMFLREGFEAVGVVDGGSGQRVSGRPPESHVVMRRRL